VIADLRLAWRMFVRGRGSSVLTVAMLAVAMAGALTLFSVLTALTTIWPELPRREQLARIYASNPRFGVERDAIPLGTFSEWASQLATFQEVAAFADDGRRVDIASGVQAQAVTSRYFEVFRVQPVAGRVLGESDDGSTRSAVLGERLARVKFGTPADAIGKSIDLGRDNYAVVGVLPRDFYFPTPSVQVWIPLDRDSSPERRIMGVGRLRDGRTWSEAAAELSAAAQNRSGPLAVLGWTVRAIPLNEDQGVRTRNGVIGLLGPAVIVLLIACVNATNLMLSRGIEREGEFSVRLVLGASRGRIVRQLLVESAVLVTVATAAGVLLSLWGIRVFQSLVAGFDSAAADRLVFTNSALLASAAIAIATPMIVSIVPALVASRRRLPSASSGVVRSRSDRSGYGPRDLLVFAEVALASVLVVTALMVFRLFGELQSVHPSYDPTPVAIADVGADVRAAGLGALIEQARAVPGIVAVATIKGPLLSTDRTARGVLSRARSETHLPCSVSEVSPDYFLTLQLSIVAGRTFDADVRPESGVAIASVNLAERLWGGRGLPASPVTLTTGGRTRQLEIIGIAAEATAPNRLVGLTGGSLYLPHDPSSAGPVSILARSTSAASSMVQPLSRALSRAVGQDQLRVRPLAEAIGFDPRDTVLVRGLLAMFSLLALTLAAGGIFAVSRHSVLQRTREFGIRLALGATSSGLVRMVMGRDMKLIAAAVALATAGTLAVTRFAFVELLRLSISDPFFWIRVLLAHGVVSTIACYTAARGISRLEPMDALRDP